MFLSVLVKGETKNGKMEKKKSSKEKSKTKMRYTLQEKIFWRFSSYGMILLLIIIIINI